MRHEEPTLITHRYTTKVDEGWARWLTPNETPTQDSDVIRYRHEKVKHDLEGRLEQSHASRSQKLGDVFDAPDSGFFGDESNKKEVVEGWVKWVRAFHWDYFITPTFRYERAAGAIRMIGEEYVKKVSPSANALIAWGGGEYHSCHLLLNVGPQPERRMVLDKRILKRSLSAMWKYGAMKSRHLMRDRQVRQSGTS